MMITSYQRPIDRPSKIYCRACGTYVVEKGSPKWPPDNLSKWYHGMCLDEGRGPIGSMVYVFDDNCPQLPVLLPWKVAKPHCGDDACEGFCDDPLCLPRTPTQTPNQVLAKNGVHPVWKVAAVVLALSNAALALKVLI